MRAERSTLITLYAAVVAPLVLFAALSLAFGLQDQRRRIEADALSRAQTATLKVDGALEAEKSALQVLIHSHALQEEDWERWRSQLEAIASQRPSWRNVTLTDVAAGRQLASLADRNAQERPATQSVAAFLARDDQGFFVEGTSGGAAGCPCLVVHAPVIRDGRITHVITAELDPHPFQDILMSTHEDGGVSAIVTRDGRFLARSLDFEEKVGTPATTFVRDAMARAPSGLYRGKTWEGLENYSAFVTSQTTGISAHVAVGAERLNGPMRRSLALIGLAGVTALALAGAIGAWALHQRAARKREDERLQQAQKLEVIGQLAGGIAHDFNNLLAVITGSLDRLSRRPELKDERGVQNALAAALRGRKLIDQLLAFSRTQEVEIDRVDLAKVADGVRVMVADTLGATVNAAVDIAEDARFVRAAASELELALLNLCVNARDAMPDGGRIDIAARREGETVAITVADTGHGMAKGVADQAFNPFFTTKPLGKGTGLGLAQVKKLADACGGSVAIDSVEGRGATVTLRLPAA